jgi:sugar (pentulose or hexulose) kinase
MEDLILSVDLGTTALKTAIFDKTGELKATATQEYSLLTPAPNMVEADTDTYWEAFKKGIAGLKNRYPFDPKSIKALGISAQGETLFCLDSSGASLRNAIVWMDSRAQDEAGELTAVFSNETCYQRTGQVSFEPCWPASKILWIRNHEPRIFKETAKFLLIEDYFIYRLTGKLVSEGSLLCSTTYWDIISKKWWPDMLQFLQVSSDNFADIREPGEAVGPILPKVAAELGLSSDTMVCTGALDQAAGAIGAGNISEGIFSETVGAALAICAPVSKPTFDPRRTMPLHYFGIPDMYMMHTFTTGGMVLRWFRDNFCRMEMDLAGLLGEDSYDILNREVANIPPGSENLIMLPHLNGAMAPDVNAKARGVFFGFTLKHQKPHFIRAIMEAMGYLVQRNIEALGNMGIRVNEIRSLGGGARSDVWNQIKSDITGKPVVTMRCKESACLGAAILAGKAVGLFPDVKAACNQMAGIAGRYTPNEANFAVYQKGYADYVKLFDDLQDLFEKSY